MPSHRRQPRQAVVVPDLRHNRHKALAPLAHIPEIDADRPARFLIAQHDRVRRGRRLGGRHRRALSGFFGGRACGGLGGFLTASSRIDAQAGFRRSGASVRRHAPDLLRGRGVGLFGRLGRGRLRLQRVERNNRRDEVLDRRLIVFNHAARGRSIPTGRGDHIARLLVPVPHVRQRHVPFGRQRVAIRRAAQVPEGFPVDIQPVEDIPLPVIPLLEHAPFADSALARPDCVEDVDIGLCAARRRHDEADQRLAGFRLRIEQRAAPDFVDDALGDDNARHIARASAPWVALLLVHHHPILLLRRVSFTGGMRSSTPGQTPVARQV